MDTPLNCLLIEDSETDALLLVEALRQGGCHPAFERVQTADALRAALQRQPWDVVFCDYVMPQFDAPSAFRVFQESGRRIPFIIVSGEIGEELAVESLKLGADDYLLKHNLKRLIPALKRALTDAENRRQRDAVRHMNELIMANSLDVICTVDEQFRFVEVSAASKHILGYGPLEMQGRRFLEFLHPDDRQGTEQAANKVLAGDVAFHHENRYFCKDGSIVHMAWSARWSPADKLMFCVGRDITGHKKTQEALRLFRGLVDQSNDVFEVIDPETARFLDVSERSCLDLGYRRAELLSLTLCDVDPTITPLGWPELMTKIRTAGFFRGEGVHRRKDGTTFPVEVNAKLVRLDREYLVAVVRDITERRLSEARIREQAQLLDKASDAIIVKDIGGHIQYWNKGAERLFGWTAEEVKGRTENFLYKDEDSMVLWQARQDLFKHGEWSGETRKCTKAGGEAILQTRWTLLVGGDGKPKAILSINTDITEKKKLEAQFLRTQRLESVGTLASGIAHDLNNVLGPIVLSLSLLEEKVIDQEGEKLLDSLAQSAKRGAAIVSQVLAFSRGMRGERIPVDLRHLLKEIRAIVGETFPKAIRMKLNVESELWNVTGDPTHLHQVLLNLCINARDAMPQGGQLNLSARNFTIDENYAVLNPDCPPGTYVLIEVRDTGEGIPADIRDRIFEPFFTTKEVGHGTGLGLSTVAGILKSHGGFIKVYSEVGKGSIFKVYLPATSAPTEDSSQVQSSQMPRGNGECILLVDDEEAILNVAQKTLERFGYKVIAAQDGAAAIALYVQHRDEIAIVLTDMVMPIMDGAATIHALMRLNPEVRIVAASGFGSESGVIKAIEAGVKHHLQKPYTTDTLLKLLHQLIHEKEEKTGDSREDEIFDDADREGGPAQPHGN
jgi:PAS domain S-box-containing protein